MFPFQSPWTLPRPQEKSEEPKSKGSHTFEFYKEKKLWETEDILLNPIERYVKHCEQKKTLILLLWANKKGWDNPISNIALDNLKIIFRMAFPYNRLTIEDIVKNIEEERKTFFPLDASLVNYTNSQKKFVEEMALGGLYNHFDHLLQVSSEQDKEKYVQPLNFLIDNKNFKAIEFLVTSEKIPRGTPQVYFSEVTNRILSEHREIFDLLVKNGVHLYQDQLHVKGFILNGRFEEMLTYHKMGMDFNFNKGKCETALQYACKHSTYKVIKFLIEKLGCDVNVSTNLGSPIHFLCFYGKDIDLDVCKLLVDKGIDPGIRDDQENNGLYYALQRGCLDVFFMLFEKNKHLINERNCNGDTLLHLAVRKKMLFIVKLLLENGADPKARNKIFETPESLAIWTECIVLNDEFEKVAKKQKLESQDTFLNQG